LLQYTALRPSESLDNNTAQLRWLKTNTTAHGRPRELCFQLTAHPSAATTFLFFLRKSGMALQHLVARLSHSEHTNVRTGRPPEARRGRERKKVFTSLPVPDGLLSNITCVRKSFQHEHDHGRGMETPVRCASATDGVESKREPAVTRLSSNMSREALEGAPLGSS
jgi:hypothetical protein